MISPLRDTVTLRAAALEFFRLALYEEEMEELTRRVRHAQNADRARLAREPGLTYADGYYVAIDYLLTIEEMKEQGCDITFRIDELRALAAVRSARTEFQREHPPCPRCSTLNALGAQRCRKCGEQLIKMKTQRMQAGA
jgi:ribosomal protein L40E